MCVCTYVGGCVYFLSYTVSFQQILINQQNLFQTFVSKFQTLIKYLSDFWDIHKGSVHCLYNRIITIHHLSFLFPFYQYLVFPYLTSVCQQMKQCKWNKKLQYSDCALETRFQESLFQVLYFFAFFSALFHSYSFLTILRHTQNIISRMENLVMYHVCT